jgi:Glycosyl hydrolases family 16/PKD domain
MTDNYSGQDYFYSGSTSVSGSGGVTISNSVWGAWHSGSLYSVDATPTGFAQQYGYFEMRAKMPASGVGSWPSFWCRTTNQITGATCNEEIDILEWYGGSYDRNSDCAQQVSHNWGSCATNQSVYNPCVHVGGARPWADYHIYGFQSDPTNITFYIDGVQSLQCAMPKNYLTCGLDLRLEYALGGGWPLTNVVANSHYDIDWVRVWALPPPTALFSATPTNGLAPLTVSFRDSSSGFITNRTWSFGDGATTTVSTASIVLHTYQAAGSFMVQLLVAGPGGASTNSKPSYIMVSQLPPSPLYWTSFGNQLMLNWSNGSGILLGSTNVALPATSWTPLVTNLAMPYVITISNDIPQMFYRAK